MTTRLYVALHGGLNYSAPDVAVEYDSLNEAARNWESRRRYGLVVKQWDRGTGTWVYCPCWGDVNYDVNGRGHAALAWYVDDDHPAVSDGPCCKVLDSVDMYPDRELTVGPRGGLRWERC